MLIDRQELPSIYGNVPGWSREEPVEIDAASAGV